MNNYDIGESMVILGIDPGYAIVGYGVVSYNGNSFKPIKYGAVTTPAGMDFSKRLDIIFNDITEIITEYKPDAVSIEKLFFNTNTTTAIDVAGARGVILLAAEKQKVPIYQYTPLQVKQAVTGYGRAEKRQIIEMTKSLLGLKTAPKPDDTADALAMAICHAHTDTSLLSKLKNTR